MAINHGNDDDGQPELVELGDEPPVQGDDEFTKESKYNGGFGIRYVVSLMRRPEPPKKGQKPKKPQVDKTLNIQIHEDTNATDWLDTILVKAKRNDLVQKDHFMGRSGQLRTKYLDIQYSIPHTTLKNVSIDSAEDYDNLIQQLDLRPTFEPEVVVILNVCEFMEVISDSEGEDEDDNGGEGGSATQRGTKRKRGDSDGDSDGEEDDEEESGAGAGKKKKKGRKLEISADDKQINDNIQAVEKRWKCNDTECHHTHCYFHPITLKHYPLDFPMKNFWGTAIFGGKATLERPPKTKEFGYEETSDEVEERRRNPNTKAKGSGTNVTVNFEGISDLIKAMRPPMANTTNSPPKQRAHTQPARANLPRLNLDEFCLAHHLDDIIKAKLEAKKISGPHALEYISDDALLGTVRLEIGELADVRFAQQSWKDSTVTAAATL